jgi:hypothetical protein
VTKRTLGRRFRCCYQPEKYSGPHCLDQKIAIHTSLTGGPVFGVHYTSVNSTTRTTHIEATGEDHPPLFAASSEYVGSASSHFTSPEGP